MSANFQVYPSSDFEICDVREPFNQDKYEYLVLKVDSEDRNNLVPGPDFEDFLSKYNQDHEFRNQDFIYLWR